MNFLNGKLMNVKKIAVRLIPMNILFFGHDFMMLALASSEAISGNRK